ncbi:rubredoxin [Phaeobacter sp. PT47_59]|nr:rubredoxin [Phaeobacter sp. PT47_59]MDE4176760.1 rubredoxin [Phaeobacter sp. PT47_59]
MPSLPWPSIAPPFTLFSQIPDDWCCPDCGATKEDYVLYEEK